MLVRWIVVFIGAVALVTGVAGLLTPVSAGPGNVGCGIAVAPDLSSARVATERGGQNRPSPPSVPETPGFAEPHDDIIVNTDYVDLCRKELTDRRIWTITLAAVGAAAALAGALVGNSRAAAIFRR